MKSNFFTAFLFLLLLGLSVVQNTPIEVNDFFVAGPPLTDQEFNSAPRYSLNNDVNDSQMLINNNRIPFEDDILIPAQQSTSGATDRNAIISRDGFLRWPNAQIPYVISADYTDDQRQKIASGMNEFHKATCIRFIPRTNEADYISIQKSGTGCNSYVGRQGGYQRVSLDHGCALHTDIVQHELMHAAGFWHEQSRYDRDDYVTINWSNIQPKDQYAYDKYGSDRLQFLGTLYDYKSIMQYTSNAFAIDSSIPAILANDGTVLGGSVFTQTDILELNRMYNCDPKDCWDDDIRTGNCTQLVAAGQCQTNTAEMMIKCKKSCNFCNSAISTSSTTTNPPSTMDCRSKANGNYPDPANPCSGNFYMCSNQVAYLFNCDAAGGLVFNPNIGACDYAYNVYPCNIGR